MAYEFEQICGSCGKQITLMEADAHPHGVCSVCSDKLKQQG